MSSSDVIAFTGGGTGGHVYPGLAVIEKLKETWDGRIVWIGSGKEVERAAVEAEGIEFFAVPAGKLRRNLSLENVVDVFKVAAGFFASRRLLAKLRPVLLFSKGGYVSVPPCRAASSLHIPVWTHESDLSPGLATRLNARAAERILLSWDKTLEYLSPENRAKAVVSGNPVRSGISGGDAKKGRQWLGFPDDGLPVVLVLGGSQGARQLNAIVEAALPALRGLAHVAHQTGKGNPEAAPASDWYRGFEFIHDELYDVTAAADIVLGRAGAGTIWENVAAGKALVLVPLAGSGSRGDQVENARLLAEAGGALTFEGEAATPEAVLAALRPLIASKEKRDAMARKAALIAKPGAARAIADSILETIARIKKERS